MRRSIHYEQAVEEYLRRTRVPYVAIDEARRTLLPESGGLKSFDFLLYGSAGPGGMNLLADVKGRKISPRRSAKSVGRWCTGAPDPWVTAEDIDALLGWEVLFGPGFAAVFLFAFWCDAQPPDALFHEIFEFRARWYILRAVRVREYAAASRIRSPRWGTRTLAREVFERLALPLAVARTAPACGDAGPEAVIEH